MARGKLHGEQKSHVAEDAQSMMDAAQQAIEQFHRGAEPAKNLIRVVYFHPSDRQPLANWKPRLQRTLENVREFYQQGLRQLGAGRRTLPLEQDEQGIVMHVVQGEHPASEYDHDSGNVIEVEVRKKLAGQIDFDKEHVLLIHGLCHQEKDGRYVFNAPYYGRGSQKQGLCHAADCELLDSDLLNERTNEIVYTEHYYPRQVQTIGMFNGWYIGGLAHELGHGIGLPHDAGTYGGDFRNGTALMGSGNHHYHEEQWGHASPANLSLATALRLLASPLLTQSNRDRFTDPMSQLTDLKFSIDKGRLEVAGAIRSSVPSYAVVAYLWRPDSWPGNPRNDHQSYSQPSVVNAGEFRLRYHELKPGDYRLRFSVLHCNGADSDFDFHLQVDRDGEANVNELNDQWLLKRVESAVLSAEPDASQWTCKKPSDDAPRELTEKLEILREMLVPPELIDLATTKLNTVYLSDAKWMSAKVGWGNVARNYYDRERQFRNSIYLELQGKFYRHGLYAHSASNYTYQLDKKFKTFTATVGLRDGAHPQGSAVFTVRGDGQVLYRSPIQRPGQSADMKINVSSINRLELISEGGEGHVHNSWAIWCAPQLSR